MVSIPSAREYPDTPTVGNSLLLLLVVWTLFVVPVFPRGTHQTHYAMAFSAVFLTAVAAMQRGRRSIMLLAVLTVITQWISRYADLPLLFVLSEGTNLVFFAIVVFNLIAQVARTQRVNALVILESINGYLLMGFFFSILVAVLTYFSPASFAVGDAAGEPDAYRMSEYIYFTLVTMTTLGYGDVLPRLPLAKSLSTLIAVTGQLYVAVIIATLVGKWAGAAATERR